MEKNYVFNNINEVKGLLEKFSKLKTNDPDIIAIMNIITKDIKATINIRSGIEAAEEYQSRLDYLGVIEFTDDVQKEKI